MKNQASAYIASAVKFVVLAVPLLASGWLGLRPRGVLAQAGGYVFQVIATIPGPAPGPEGGQFTSYLAPYGVSNSAKVTFTAGVSTGGEGVFLLSKRRISQLARSGEAAPGGGTFDLSGTLGQSPLNAEGDLVFSFSLNPQGVPCGVNSGLYSFSHITGRVTNVVEPFVTPAPGGGKFHGVWYYPSINNRGEIVFTGVIPTGQGTCDLGLGLFQVQQGRISSVVSPGDPAPGGRNFKSALTGWVNDRGDVGFQGVEDGEQGIGYGVYLKKASSGEILPIARPGDPSPDSGIFGLAFGPVLNSQGDVAFIGDLTEPPAGFGDTFGVFLNHQGDNFPVARPGDPMPGGGNLVTASIFTQQYSLNNSGDVVFNCVLDTDLNNDNKPDTGLYMFSHGSLRLVGRSGTVIPGVGTIAHLQSPGNVGFPYTDGGGIINDIGQVLFQATLEDGTGVLLLATPSAHDGGS